MCSLFESPDFKIPLFPRMQESLYPFTVLYKSVAGLRGWEKMKVPVIKGSLYLYRHSIAIQLVHYFFPTPLIPGFG
jgi:hypothetical protein